MRYWVVTNKELLLSMRSYEEFDRNRGKFTPADFADKEVINHLNQIFPKAYAPKDMHREVRLVDGE